VAERGEHSAKPASFREAIERMYPTLPRVELFARTAPKGWMTWGNQA
jgi:N6-adenosine-specific RNA methylase IME4